MFFLVPRIAVLLIVCFSLILLVRALRPRFGRRRRVTPRPPFPLLPAAVMQGADRTWVVFTKGDRPEIAERLRRAEPASQVTEIDTRVEPRLAEAFRIRQVPALLLANRYGQIEAQLVGADAVESALF
ncbi:MAG TPA: hypothetical protein VHT75_04515 [Acidimicrobiales bacterium]|jgi:hypothetical protein|nr:hypothetical protein [Acidimicrobiales bacterium]